MVEATAEKFRGRCKFFSQRGFGFLLPENEKDPEAKGVFFHCSQVAGRSLEPDEEVTYELASGEKGEQAVNIERVS